MPRFVEEFIYFWKIESLCCVECADVATVVTIWWWWWWWWRWGGIGGGGGYGDIDDDDGDNDNDNQHNHNDIHDECDDCNEFTQAEALLQQSKNRHSASQADSNHRQRRSAG